MEKGDNRTDIGEVCDLWFNLQCYTQIVCHPFSLRWISYIFSRAFHFYIINFTMLIWFNTYIVHNIILHAEWLTVLQINGLGFTKKKKPCPVYLKLKYSFQNLISCFVIYIYIYSNNTKCMYVFDEYIYKYIYII